MKNFSLAPDVNGYSDGTAEYNVVRDGNHHLEICC